MIRVGIVTNPFDPSTWQEFEVDDVRALLVEQFAEWPSTARIYDLSGFGDWTRAAAITDPSVLAARDVTPQDEAGVERLAQLTGPVLVTIPPADPLTAIIAVVAIAVGVAAAFLLMPKIPGAGRQPSPNNSLSERSNQARPNQRVPDIFGTVEATPDLLAVPYSLFENNIEVEVAYMGVGRGSYAISRIRDGDTALASISGSSAAVYAPGTSPNSGDAPQLQIGPAIPELVQSVIKLNEVNGQTLQPTNLNSVQGENSIRFVYPDSIETNDNDLDFTKFFSANDALAIASADISGSTGTTTLEADARFNSAGDIDFLDPADAASFAVGQTVTITKAGYAADNTSGGALYVDLSGTYQVGAVAQKDRPQQFGFTAPAMPSGATIKRASTGTRYNSAGALTTEAIDAPRFDYDAAGNLIGLLVEAAATNLMWPSQDMTSAQYGKNSSTATATRLTEAASGSGRAFVNQLTAVTAGKTYTLSVEAAEVSGPKRYLMLLLNPSGFGELKIVVFNLATKAMVTAGSGVTGRIVDLANGRKLCSITATATATASPSNQVGMRDDFTARVDNYTLASGAMDLTNFQLEEGVRLTSRIITTTAAATRAADVVTLDWGSKGYADGALSITFTLGDNSTQTVNIAIAGGKANIPTPLNNARIKSVRQAGTYQAVTLSDPAGVNSDWSKLSQYPNGRTEYRSVAFSVATTTAGINLNGNYTALSVTSSTIVLNNPALVNASWNNLDDQPGGATDYVSPNISRSTESWVGPYIVDLLDAQELLANVIAPNGLYTLSKEKGRQRALSVGVVLEATPVNSNDAAVGPAQLFPATIVGSDKERTTVGYSLRADPTFSGRCSIRMRRTTPTPPSDDFGAVVDEVKWRDAYGLAPVDQEEFGDATTVMTRTLATAGALSVKSRRLNMRVTRKLPTRQPDGSFGPPVATDSAADILVAMALDPYIGRRATTEVDFDSIYDTIAELQGYFGTVLATQFGYTFDDTDISFEEMAQTVAQAVFCRAFRQGRVIRLSFERAMDSSSLIFNSRNIMPGTLKRTVRFGPLDDHDGVELDWVDPVDGAPMTAAVPPYEALTSARSLEVPGVRSRELAYWQTWRAWNKVRFQNMATEMEATQEAALVIPNDRVLIVDRTQPGSLEGEIENADGATLTLSTPADLDPALHWTIFIQHIDETVEALGVTQGVDALHVVTSAVPRMPLSTDAQNFARATYVIVHDDDTKTRPYLVTEREPASNFTESVRAVNYSFLYYQHDELVAWLDFGASMFLDSGPHQYDGTPFGSAALVVDAGRGGKRVYTATANDARVALADPLISPVSYTKAAWLNVASPTIAGEIFVGNGEFFSLSGDGGIILAHAGQGPSVYAFLPPAGEWFHAVATYDADSGVGSIYLNGRLAAQSGGIGRGVRGPLAAMSGLVAKADDMRVWKRALTPTEIRSVYLGSKVSPAV